MRFLFGLLQLLLTAPLVVASTFQKDVVNGVEQRLRLGHSQVEGGTLHDELLSRATLVTPELRRRLDDRNKGQNGAADDYYVADEYKYSFQGYSLKYAKCQTIKRFSEDAIKNGEYSAMVSDDIVILRLCPYQSCSSAKQFGCYYNFAEYAIGLGDYLKVMLKYRIDKNSNLCSFCATCESRRLEQGENNKNENNNDNKNEDNNENKNENQGRCEARVVFAPHSFHDTANSLHIEQITKRTRTKKETRTMERKPTKLKKRRSQLLAPTAPHMLINVPL